MCHGVLYLKEGTEVCVDVGRVVHEGWRWQTCIPTSSPYARGVDPEDDCKTRDIHRRRTLRPPPAVVAVRPIRAKTRLEQAVLSVYAWNFDRLDHLESHL